MKCFKYAISAFLVTGSVAFADGHATGDAANGENVFSKCKACHAVVNADGETVVKGGRTGPNLFGVYQRVAGKEEDYGRKYGEAIVEAGEAGLIWEEDNFVAYVSDPRGYLREYLDDKRARSKMSFKLKDSQDAHDVWAYLVSIGPDPEMKEKSE